MRTSGNDRMLFTVMIESRNCTWRFKKSTHTPPKVNVSGIHKSLSNIRVSLRVHLTWSRQQQGCQYPSDKVKSIRRQTYWGILEKYDSGMWNGFILLRIETSGKLL